MATVATVRVVAAVEVVVAAVLVTVVPAIMELIPTVADVETPTTSNLPNCHGLDRPGRANARALVRSHRGNAKHAPEASSDA